VVAYAQSLLQGSCCYYKVITIMAEQLVANIIKTLDGVE
jgi:hypothetical protein